MSINGNKIIETVKAIRRGNFNEVEFDDVKIYSCGNIVRIDIKNTAELDAAEQNGIEEGAKRFAFRLESRLEETYGKYDFITKDVIIVRAKAILEEFTSESVKRND